MNKKHRTDRILRTETIGFIIIIILSWLTELTRLPHLIFGEPFAPNWHRAILRTVVIIGVWFWVRFETRRILARLHYLEEFLLVCSWCRKIGHEGQWVSMEKYFGSKFSTQTSHGMCPECSAKMIEKAEKKSPADESVADAPR